MQDRFDDNNINFLDIAIDKNKTDLYYKPTHTGQYSDINSNIPCNYEFSWIKSLYHQADKICSSSKKFRFQINKIKMFMSWNGYPSFTRDSIINQLKTPPKIIEKEKDDRKIIWIRLQCLGNISDSMKKSCLKKIQKYLKENVRFKTCYETKKTAIFCSAKERNPIHQKANVIYKVTCPGRNEDYFGKTDRNLVTRLNEHAFREDQPKYQHLSKCEHYTLLIYITRH